MKSKNILLHSHILPTVNKATKKLKPYMKSFNKKLTSWLDNIEKELLKKRKKENQITKKITSEAYFDEAERIPGKFYPEVDDYQDKYIYRHMDPADKKKPKYVALSSFPKKEVYKCFGWQLHPYDIEKLASYILNNPRLSFVMNKSALAGAKEADILILTSGSGKYHMDSFLSDLDTSKKIIIIASVRDLSSVKEDITHRIDAHFNKLHPFSQSDFNNLIDKVIEEATRELEDEEVKELGS